MSLGLSNNLSAGAFAPEPRHKSAGLAFGLSLLLPGLGQFYCDKIARGGLTLGFWLAAVVLCFADVSKALIAEGLLVTLVLWIFSFLDAYFTAVEINQGQDEQVDVQNPRVAVTLNLLTAGLGYFYLGERAKGIAIFVGMQVARLVFPATRSWGILVAVVLLIVRVLAAYDAYRIARRQVKEALGPEAALPIANTAVPSRLPVQVPVVLACMAPVGFAMLVGIGVIATSMGSQKHGGVPLASQPSIVHAEIEPDRQMENDTPIPAVDLATAVQDVQRVQRKAESGKEETPNLKQDVQVLSAILSTRKVEASDALVAHYFRAIALAIINLTREHDGDATDLPAARMARSDFDRIIGAKSVRTYVPDVSHTNAEFWAGIVARNLLHDEVGAYSYWEKCALMAHAGCINNVASARITGAGGQKVDVQEALGLHSIVFNSGVRYRCAGAFSAMGIAEINYFTGVRRSGDDELEWTRKAEALLDQLERTQSDRNVCHRVEFEVEDFLFQLSRGHKDEDILQDAVSRLDDDSNTTKAVIQFISGAIDEAGFDAAMRSSKSQGERCSGYFDAMWFAELRSEDAMARRYYQRMVDIGKFHCGENLVYAAKFKL